jgi:hypothetical protein
VFKVGGGRRFEAHLSARARVPQAHPPGVEHRPRSANLPSSVFGIARHRVPQRGEVHADLMRSPGVEVTAQESMPMASFDHLVPRSRESPAADHRHPLPLVWVTPDRPFELASIILHASTHDRHVGAAERAVLELR